MRRSLMVLAAILLGGIAAAAQVTVTPTLVSAQSGADLYCAARPINGQIQVYCFVTTGTPWDTLVSNGVYTVNATSRVVPVPDIIRLPAGCSVTLGSVVGAPPAPGCAPIASVGWILAWINNAVAWQVTVSGQISSGTF